MAVTKWFSDKFPLEKKDWFFIAFSVLCIILLFLLLFCASPWWFIEGEEAIGVVRTGHKVKRRIAKTLVWGDIRKEGTVYLKDYIYTPDSTDATVIFDDDSQLMIFPNSLVQLNRLADGSYEIILVFGRAEGMKVRRQVAKKILFEKVVTQVKPPEDLEAIEPLEQAQKDLDARLAVLKPSELKGAKSQSPTLLPLNRLRHYELQLRTPENGSNLNVGPQEWFNVGWSPILVRNTNLEIQVSKFPDFSRSLTYQIKQKELGLHSLRVRFDESEPLYWRMRAKKGKERLESPVYRFQLSKASQ